MNKKIIVGWREVLSLPELRLDRIKAKIDTGARTSCLHAYKLETFTRNNTLWVRFWMHPEQNNTELSQICEAKVINKRVVRDSGGHEEERYVVETLLSLGGEQWPIEITLTNRENMRFRMLLGRTAMRNRIIVDPTESFLVPLEEKK
ncbi:ATP-dependent zinc protease [Vibrio sp. S9_S30]|uniref:ATP-dependent zinc protease family protein n=1 Tax=Vibrio sp. S9_S30 TaxID=2720226 RepID=UPI001680F8A1|nr:ATP-dependent zinc protease [Vibrio sp. S9_S30]MBD1556691.1 ATP-dependent zinc protease [Vibrio sp. S9_S30]